MYWKLLVCGLLFIILTMSFEDHNFFNLISFSFFFLMYPKKYLLNQKPKDFFLEILWLNLFTLSSFVCSMM